MFLWHTEDKQMNTNLLIFRKCIYNFDFVTQILFQLHKSFAVNFFFQKQST